MVTGGCGFIGSHLVARLCALGARKVVVLDNLRCGRKDNLEADPSRLTWVNHDLGFGPAAALEEATRGVDFVFHLAAEKHNQSKDSPERLLRSNIEGMYQLLASAARCGVGKVVFSSSLYAYGRMRGGPFREDEVPRPSTVYGVSKLAGEHLLEHFRAKEGLRSTALRFLFVHGPKQFAGMGYKSVIMKNFERLLRGESPVVFGDGRQALDYVFVDDVVEAVLASLDPKADGGVFNVGTGEAVSVMELTRTMLKVAGSALPIVHGPPDWTDGTCRVADPSRIRQALGWSAKVSLAEGLSRTFEWMRGQPAGGRGE